jgi:hypothetical protein
MAETRTKFTGASVDAFIDAVRDARKRDDSRELIAMMRRITGEEPRMWGPTIVGFGNYHYKYESGHEGDAPVAGFSPRKAALSIYLMPEFEKNQDLMKRLGKYTAGKACLYVKKLDDIDRGVLQELVERSVEWVRKEYPG